MFTLIVGYAALTLNLYSMSLKGEHKLRLYSAIANSIYVIYGLLIQAYPIIIGATIAVVLHITRLEKLKRAKHVTH
jgi:hypothetical protein